VLETHHDAEPILVSPRQALRLLDISNSSLYGLLRSGQLRSLMSAGRGAFRSKRSRSSL
jgi:hypothetical protein